MKIEGSEELFDALAELPVEVLQTGHVLNEAQHAAIQTASKLGQVVVMVWDGDRDGYWFGALDIDGDGE